MTGSPSAPRRGNGVASRRDLLIVAAVVVLTTAGIYVWHRATGADTGTSLGAGASAVFIMTVGITANQIAARRRARRRGR